MPGEPMITMPQEDCQQLIYEKEAMERKVEFLMRQVAALRAKLIVHLGGCSNVECDWERGHSGPCNTGREG